MKFEKLYNLVLEAGFRPSAPKNMGGSRVQRVKDAEGPAQYSASSVGRNLNPEVQTPITRWEFDPAVDMDKGGIKKQAKSWRTLFNAFSILSNDKTFQEAVLDISKKFDKRRDSYKNILGISDEEGNKGFIKYDEESRVNTLPATIDKQIGKRTEYESEIAKRRTTINYTKLGPSAKFELVKNAEVIRAKIKAIEKELAKDGISRLRKGKLESELRGFNISLGKLEDKIQAANVGSTESMKAEILDFTDKIAELDKKIEKNQEELKTLTDRTTKIQSNNEENNDIAIQELKDQVNLSAKKIKNDLGEQIKEFQMVEDEGVEDVDNVMEVDWNNIPKSFKTKVAMLDALASTDPSVNPIFGYIESFNNWYYDFSPEGERSRVKDLDSREFNPQLNITKIRDYMSLPFVRVMSIYSTSSIPKMSLKKEADLKKHDNIFSNFEAYINQFPNSKDPSILQYNKESWNDPETKEMLRSFIAGMAIENKDIEYSMINRPWGVSRSGANSFQQLKSMIISDMKRFRPVQESFDSIFEEIINEKIWDEDDFKLNTMEILSLVGKPK